MIAFLLEKLGVPKWGAIAALRLLLIAGALAYRAHLIDAGVAIEAARRDAIDAEQDRRAQAALMHANEQTAAAQQRLNAVMANLSLLQSELSHEQVNSAVLQSELGAGRRRLSVLTRARAPAPAGPDQCTAVAGVDTGTALAADLDARVASDLEWARQTRNEAIERLDACSAAYDAVRAATSVTLRPPPFLTAARPSPPP
jgi:hypothetical protein